MFTASTYGFGVAGPGQVRELVAAVDEWISRFSAVPDSLRFRSPVQDSDDPAAVGAIRMRGQSFYPILSDLIAFDGRAMRTFEATWSTIRSTLNLKGEDKPNPVSYSSPSITASLEKLIRVRKMLALLLPPDVILPTVFVSFPEKRKGIVLPIVAAIAGAVTFIGATIWAGRR